MASTSSRRATSPEFESPQMLTRRFSDEMNTIMPQNDLIQALADKEAHDESERKKMNLRTRVWQDLFRPDFAESFRANVEERRLEEQTRDLAQAWLKFQDKCVPASQRVDARTPPSLDDVASAVVVADQQWHEKRMTSSAGKWKARFGKMSRKLVDHKALFAIVPDGDKYVSLLAGSITAIVKASANHETIAESISRAMENFSDDIPYWKKLMMANRHSATMASYIERLYVVMFKFLTDIMSEWSSASTLRRLLKSFDGGYVDNRLNSMRIDISALTRMLEREDNLEFHADVRDRLRSIPNQHYFDQKFDITTARFGNVMQRNSFLGQDAQVLLYATVEKLLAGNHLAIETGTPSLHGDCHQADEALVQSTHYSCRAIKLAIEPLRQCFPLSLLSDWGERSEVLRINYEIFQRLQEWYAARESRAVWILGPAFASRPSSTSLTAAYIFETGRLASVPVIAHVCECVNHTQISRQRAAVDLVWSLIYQIAIQLPDDFESKLDFTPQRLGGQDRTISTLPEAVQLLSDLLSVGPQVMFCVVDGLECITPVHGYDSCIANLVKVLSMPSVQGSSRVLKTMFTTDGFTEALSSLPNDQIVDAEGLETARGGDCSLGASELDITQHVE